MEYKGLKGKKFKILFVDPQTLKQIALETGLHCEIVYSNEHGDFLAKIA
ncbi:MAG: hypothetical protein ACW990_13340 [Promethearchaeota archaeon]